MASLMSAIIEAVFVSLHSPRHQTEITPLLTGTRSTFFSITH
jgi:hypothetical protein